MNFKRHGRMPARETRAISPPQFLSLIGIIVPFCSPRVALRNEGRPLAV